MAGTLRILPAKRLRRLAIGMGLSLAAFFGLFSFIASHAADDPNATKIAQGIQSFAGVLDGLNSLEELADPVAFTGLLPTGEDGLRFASVFADSLESKIAAKLAGSGFDSIASLDAFLDDPDENGNAANDGNYGGVLVNVEGSVTEVSSSVFDVTLTLNLDRQGTTPLSLSLPSINASGGSLTTDTDVLGTLGFRLDASLPEGHDFFVLAATPPSLTVGLDADADFTATPYSVNLGLTQLGVTGAADIGTEFIASLVDPTPDDRITRDDWESTAALDLFEVSFGTSHANLDLSLASDIPGTPTGTVTLADSDLSPLGSGIATPTVDLGDLANFNHMTPQDFLAGLANVAGALDAIQQTGPGDINLPLMKEALSEVLVLNQRLRNFFTSNGLSPAGNPLSLGPPEGVTTEAYAATISNFDTIQEISTALRAEEALGVSLASLGIAYNATEDKLTFNIVKNEALSPAPLAVDLANQLERVGVTGVEDASSSVTVTPTITLNFGVGVDLGPPTIPTDTVLDLFSLETGGDPELQVDLPISGNLDLAGEIGFLGIDIADSNASGSIPLLAKRAGDSSPMLSVNVDGGSDNSLSLAELFVLVSSPPSFSSGDGSITPAINASIPTSTLTAKANVQGGTTTIAEGTLTFGWADILIDDPEVTADPDFKDELLDFDFDHSDPLALFNQILNSVEAFAAALDNLASSAQIMSTDLPFSGQSFDDLGNKFQQISQAIDELIGDPPQTVQVLESRIEDILGNALQIPLAQRQDILGISIQHSSPTSILFDLSYGICSAAGPDCLKVTGPLSVPFNFGLGESSGGIVGLDGTGEVDVGYAAKASVDFGVQLPEVTAGTIFGSTPTVVGSPSAFVIDTSYASLSANVTAGGVVSATVGPVNLQVGNNDVDPANPLEGKLAAGITLDNDFGPAGPTRIAVPSTDFDTYIGNGTAGNGITPSNIHPATGVTCTFDPPDTTAYDACAELPVYNGTDLLGTIVFKAPDLTNPGGWVLDGHTQVLESLIGLGFDWTKVLEGLQLIVAFIDESLESSSFGQDVPVVGDALDAGADVAGKLNAVLADLNDLAGDLEEAGKPSIVMDVMKQQLFDALALDGGGSLLRDRADDADADVTKEDIRITLMCNDGIGIFGGDFANGETTCDDSFHDAIDLSDVRVGLSIGQDAVAGTPVDFDIGLPGLRIEMNDVEGDTSDDLVGSIDWEIDLAFGISLDDGFYIRTDNPHNLSGGPVDDDEATLSSTLELPNNLSGDIVFLPFTLTDSTNSPLPPDLSLTFGLDLLGGGPDNRIPFTDLSGSLEPNNPTVVTPTLGGNVNLSFHFETGPFGTEDESVPKFVADFLLDWDFTSGNVLAGDSGDLTIEFNNVGIDLGSLLGDFLGPILGEANRLVKPLKPVVDIVTAPIPGLTDAASLLGCPLELPFPPIVVGKDLCKFSLLDAYELQDGSELTLIRQLIAVINFITAVNTAGGQPIMELGDFDILPGVARGGALSGNEAGGLIDSSSYNPGDIPNPLSEDDSSGNGLSQTMKDVLADAKKVGTEKGGFSFPAFDNPSNLFKLLVGQDVTLVHWDAGPLEASVTIPLEIGPPIGPLPVSLGITIQFGVRGHFAVGYDTRGIRLAVKALSNEDSGDDGVFELVGTLFAGIGIDDRLRVNGEPTGEDIPEITLFGSVTAKAALDIFIAEAGVRGGVKATLDANLHDGGFGPAFHEPDSDQFAHFAHNLDGVLRIEEIASFLGNPICLFDYTGVITAFLEAYIDYTLDEETFTIVGPVEIYNFSDLFRQACEQKPVLSHVDSDTGDLVIHIGAFANLRDYQEGVTAEKITVRQLNEAGTKFSIAGFGFEEEKSGVTGKVFADGGSDNDTVLLEAGTINTLGENDAIDTQVIPFTKAAILCGGAGVDVLQGGAGADKIVGDGGHVDPSGSAEYDCSTGEAGTDGGDTIDAREGADNIWGLGGGDNIRGGLGGDSFANGGGIRGGTGNDTIHGGPGDGDVADTIIAGPLSLAEGQTDADTVFAGKGDDYVDGGADNDIIEGDAGGDTLLGWTGNDTIHGRLGDDQIFGEGDHDTLHGDEDNDVISGGSGDDDVFGSAGDDTLNGGNDNDDLFGGTDNTGVSGDTTGDTLNGGKGRDYLLGDEGTIVRPTGQANGTMLCTGSFAGNDAMNGNDGDDVMNGCAGVDTMHGNDGSDDMHGGLGDDQMHGDEGPDMMFGDQGIDTMNGNAGNDNPMRGGDDGDIMHGNAGEDTMFGDSGADTMFGDENNDLMRGNHDADCMEGNAGVDTMHGDAGADEMIGGTSVAGASDEGDFMFGGIGNDEMTGDNAEACSPIVLYDIAFLGEPAPPASVSGQDSIDGGPNDDVIYGQGDNDSLSGGTGADYVEGNSGTDTINGNDGEDDLIGGSGKDEGGPDGAERELRTVLDTNDIIDGGGSVDFILGDNGRIDRPGETYLPNSSQVRSVELYNVELLGGPAVDEQLNGPDAVNGGTGDDTIFGQGDNDDLRGGDGEDDLEGNAGADTLRGDAGQDNIVGGGSANDGIIDDDRVGNGLLDEGETAMYGESDNTPGTPEGSGADVMAGDNARILRTIDPDNGLWQINSFNGNYVRTLQLFDIEIEGQPAVDAAVHGPDVMWGNSNDDIMRGQGDKDEMHGGAGDDFMFGNHDSDTMFGDGEDDDMLGGSPVEAHLDAGDFMYGDTNADGSSLPPGVTTDGDDVMLGDNGIIDRPLTGGMWTPIVYHNGASTRITRNVTMLNTGPGVTSGSDFMRGNGADDDMYGQFDDGEASTLTDIGCGTGTLAQVKGDLMCGDAGEDAMLGDQGTVENRSEDGGPRQRHIEPKEPFIEDDIFVAGTLTRITTLTQIATGGDDVMLGGSEGDSMHGGFGSDLMNGNSGEDRLFGGDGVDALWGGQNHDHVYGGYGNDFLDVNPRPTSTPTKPNKPPTPADPPSWFIVAPVGDNYQGIDYLYGGFDQDALQADEGVNGPHPGDRLLDWVGAYNIYYVCPAVYGDYITTRDLSPGILQYLQDQALGDGALDPATPGSSGFRELALVYPKDAGVNNKPAHPETPGHFVCT
ncbi:MAG: hypothetical protein KY429_02250 [Actinobacteria bacterium]|nr:hypothetical protein [Actinomycetota bacterium]